jgi:hypothetical protein
MKIFCVEPHRLPAFRTTARLDTAPFAFRRRATARSCRTVAQTRPGARLGADALLAALRAAHGPAGRPDLHPLVGRRWRWSFWMVMVGGRGAVPFPKSEIRIFLIRRTLIPQTFSGQILNILAGDRGAPGTWSDGGADRVRAHAPHACSTRPPSRAREKNALIVEI